MNQRRKRYVQSRCRAAAQPGGNDFDGDYYEQAPKGNLDVTGRYFIWTANLGGNRLDAFLVKVPAELLAK